MASSPAGVGCNRENAVVGRADRLLESIALTRALRTNPGREDTKDLLEEVRAKLSRESSVTALAAELGLSRSFLYRGRHGLDGVTGVKDMLPKGASA